MQSLTVKQKKTAIAIIAVLLFVHFLPNISSSFRNTFGHRSPMPAVQPHVAPPPTQIAAKPITNAPPLIDPLTAQFIGIFSGQQLMPDMSNCRMKLEVRPAIARPGFYSGFEEMACVPSPLFYRGPLTAQRRGQLPNIIAEASPVSAEMSGSVIDGAMVFHVDQVIGATPLHCGLTSYSLSNFGSNQVMAQWSANPCPGGHMILLRARG